MSGGFFRGTSADQDTRFSNKHAKLMKSQKFASELEHLVDMSKVKMDVLKPWIATRVTEFLGFEDEVLINFIYGLLDGKVVNGKEVQIQLTGFMEKNTGKFMRELWTLLLSAEKNATGVPQQFLDAKEEETRKKKAETDQIANEIQRRKDKEVKELEQEKLRKMDGADISKFTNGAVDPNTKITRRRASSTDPEDEAEGDARNGPRGQNRVSKSPNSAGESSRSRSVSKSPQPRGRPSASEIVHRSPQRRSITPRRRHSPGDSLSPSRLKSSHYIRRSRSPSYRRPISPVRRRIESPARRRSPPLRYRSPVRRRFRSPVRRRSRSPASLSPVRRRSPYHVRRRSPSPIRRRSPSLIRRRSPSPVRRRSPSPVRRRSPSPVRRRSPSPVRRRLPSPVRRRSPSPVRRRSPSPVQRRHRRSSTPRRGSPPLTRHRSPIAGRRRSPIPSQHRSPSPYGSGSLSPAGHRSSSPVQRKFPEDHKKSPLRSPKERTRGPVERRGSVAVQPPSSFRSPQKDAKDHRGSRKRSPLWSSSPEKSQILSESPPGTRKRIGGKDKIPYESPMRQKSSPQKPKEHKSLSEKDGIKYFREDGDHKSRSSQRRSPPSTAQHKEAPEKSGSHQITESRSNIVDARKRNPELQSEKTSGKMVNPEVSEKQKSPLTNKRPILAEGPPLSHIVDKIKSDEKILSKSKNTKDGDQIGSFDSGSEDSDKDKYDYKEKRKHKRSDRHANDDNSSDSQIEDKKEAKRRKKEERRVRKEEKRRRHEEKRQRRREERRIEKLKAMSKDNSYLPSDMGKNKEENYVSDGKHVTRMRSGSSDDEGDEYEKNRLEVELRNKALESLQAKKGSIRH